MCDALLLHGGGVVSLVGAGGKTSLMYRLARELAGTGQAVLTTTTTRIYPPAGGPVRRLHPGADGRADPGTRGRSAARTPAILRPPPAEAPNPESSPAWPPRRSTGCGLRGFSTGSSSKRTGPPGGR
ncbi:MAG: hypothetical protein MZV70_11045 [Desulfobacterales bacterium]|nr:hypothetical protein [Desulfobacterales bacterium]